MNETWRAVPGYGGLYEVSDCGRVKSVDRVLPRRWRGRALKPIPMPSGYLVVNLWRDGRQRTALVHRLVLLAFAGDAPRDHEALHLDGDNTNNQIENLAWGTHSENQHHQVAHGTHANATKAHCPQGHPFSNSNTYLYPGKQHRACRTCRRDYAKALRARNIQTAKESA